MKDLIFIGGARGVGKTTITDKVKETFGLSVINTGDIVRDNRRQNLNIEAAIYCCLLPYRGLVDTHYAGYILGKFVRGLSKEYLVELNRQKSIDFILIDLDVKTLVNRRIADTKISRESNFESVAFELEMNRFYFDLYCKDLLMGGIVIQNIDLDDTVSKILRRLK